MKTQTKEVKSQKSTKTTKSMKNTKNTLGETKVDYDEVKRKLNQGNMAVAQPLPKETHKGPSKSQINRLKKFYNTTRWLPNSAFTTYFGKPAFENYGYGNTNPVYGGLFYGNYMLSHNMNPIDGANHPPEKQVYSSAMMKSVQRKGIRKPSPPRKVPEEIRNTPEELQEIRTRKQIFQLPNNFPSRDIIPPNLLKARYFRSGKNTPQDSEDEDAEEYEMWNIENVLSGKANKKMKIKKMPEGKFNPYSQGRVELKRKKMKEGLDNKFSDEFYQKATARHLRKKKGKQGEAGEEEEEYEESEGQLLYEKQREYYLKMLGEDQVKNLEDLTNLEVQKDVQPYDENQQKVIQDNNVNNINYYPPQYENQNMPQQNQEIQGQANMEHNCNVYPLNEQIEHKEETHVPTNPLKKKENPALLPPNYELLKSKDNNFVCCVHHSQLPINYQEKDPRNYQGMPPCMLSSIIPAGKPSHVVAPLNVFDSGDGYYH
jgi:hypothetical protein